MPTIYIVRGVPGSGKTTYVQDNLAGTDWYESDMYFTKKDGSYLFIPRFLGDAHNWCQASVHTAMTTGHDVVVSNTFTKLWEMQKYLEMAKEFGYSVTVIRCTGCYQNVHGVPVVKVQQMRNRFEDYCGEILI